MPNSRSLLLMQALVMPLLDLIALDLRLAKKDRLPAIEGQSSLSEPFQSKVLSDDPFGRHIFRSKH